MTIRKILIVIPAYNEEDNITTVINELRDEYPSYDYVIVNDGSLDRTSRICKENGFNLISLPINLGLSGAFQTGMKFAYRNGYDAALQFDADGQHDPAYIGAMVERMEQTDADIVIGSRNLSKDGYEGYTLLRKLASKAYIRCLAFAAGFKLSDSQCGFKGFRRETAQASFSECEVNGFAFDFEVLIKAKNMGKKILEMPVKVINHRESKVSVLRDSVKMLKDVRKIKKRNKK